MVLPVTTSNLWFYVVRAEVADVHNRVPHECLLATVIPVHSGGNQSVFGIAMVAAAGILLLIMHHPGELDAPVDCHLFGALTLRSSVPIPFLVLSDFKLPEERSPDYFASLEHGQPLIVQFGHQMVDWSP